MQNDTIYGDLLLPAVLAVVTYRGASSANRVRVELYMSVSDVRFPSALHVLPQSTRKHLSDSPELELCLRFF